MNTAIFTDGSSRGNPGRGGWGAILATETQIIELGGYKDHTTNNEMELLAVIESLREVGKQNIKQVDLYTDSSYVLNSASKWVFGWQKKGWRTATGGDVANQTLWEEYLRVSKGMTITWHHVRGHEGVLGNERCDVIATSFADTKKADLYNGARASYPHGDLSDTQKNKSRASGKTGSKATPKNGYYISFLEGKLERHKTWAECEKRVKGKPAKFKKVTNDDEEREYTKKWGV